MTNSSTITLTRHPKQTAYIEATARYHALRAEARETVRASGVIGRAADKLYGDLYARLDVSGAQVAMLDAERDLIDWGLDLVVAAAPAARPDALEPLVDLAAKRSRLVGKWADKLCRIFVRFDWRQLEALAA